MNPEQEQSKEESPKTDFLNVKLGEAAMQAIETANRRLEENAEASDESPSP